MDYLLHIATLTLIFLVLAQAMNIYLGYTGILALSHVAFWGMGAYISAIMTRHADVVAEKLNIPETWVFWVSFPTVIVITAVLGILVGLTSIRLRADYLGIATLGFAQIVSTVFQTSEITRGPLGLPGIPRPTLLGEMLNTKAEYFLFTAMVSALLLYLMYRMVKSPYGRLLETIRDDEIAAKVLGKNTNFYKLSVFAIGSVIAAIMGIVYAHFITYISPMSFHINELSVILVMTVLGGLGTYRGPFFGAFLIIFLQEGVRFLKDIPGIPIEAQHIGGIQMLSYNLLFLLVMIYFPQGIGGTLKHKKRHRKQFTQY